MLKNKKILLTMLVVLLILILPNMVNAETVNAEETTKTSTQVDVEWSYELDGNNAKNLKCTNISSVTGSLTIPSTIDSHNVISLGSSAFANCSGLTGIIISDKTTSIGNYAFSNCSGLKSVTIPNGVTTIGDYAFQKCTGLTSITIPNNVTKLSDAVFNGCDGITEISLPDNLTTICWWALNCDGLKFVKMPENIVSIDKSAFGSLTGKNITIFGKEGSTAQIYAKNNNINFEKIENWDKRNSNVGSDITAPTVKSMYFDYSTVLNYWDKTTNDYRIPRGIELPIIVRFTETIKGTQTPTLTIKCGEGANIELKNGVISGDKIVYTYKINKNDEGLITAVKLEGGNVSDSSNNKAVLSVKELKAELTDNYVYANGSVANTNSNNSDNNNQNTSSNDKIDNTTNKDTTIAKKVLPYTGKVILIWSITIVAVSAVVAHIRYKRL